MSKITRLEVIKNLIGNLGFRNTFTLLCNVASQRKGETRLRLEAQLCSAAGGAQKGDLGAPPPHLDTNNILLSTMDHIKIQKGLQQSCSVTNVANIQLFLMSSKFRALCLIQGIGLFGDLAFLHGGLPLYLLIIGINWGSLQRSLMTWMVSNYPSFQDGHNLLLYDHWSICQTTLKSLIDEKTGINEQVWKKNHPARV